MRHEILRSNLKYLKRLWKIRTKSSFAQGSGISRVKDRGLSLPSLDEVAEKLPEKRPGKIKLSSLNELDIDFDSEELDLNAKSLTPSVSKKDEL